MKKKLPPPTSYCRTCATWQATAKVTFAQCSACLAALTTGPSPEQFLSVTYAQLRLACIKAKLTKPDLLATMKPGWQKTAVLPFVGAVDREDSARQFVDRVFSSLFGKVVVASPNLINFALSGKVSDLARTPKRNCGDEETPQAT